MVWWVPLITALVSAGGAAYGARQQKKALSQMSDKELQRLIKQGIAESQPEGLRLLKEGSKDLEEATQFYRALLSGDRNAIAQATGPQLSEIGNQFTAARQNISEFTPRGGGAASLLSDLPMAEMKAKGNVLLQARPGAAQSLANIGAQRAALGHGVVSGATGGALSANRQHMDQEQFGYGAGEELGAALAGFLGNVDWGAVFGRGGGGAAPTSNTSALASAAPAFNFATAYSQPRSSAGGGAPQSSAGRTIPLGGSAYGGSYTSALANPWASHGGYPYGGR